MILKDDTTREKYDYAIARPEEVVAVAMVKKTHAYRNKLRALELERSGGITNKKSQKTDIDECKEKKACQYPECSCKNTWGSYNCSCSGDLLYIRDHDTCISKTAANHEGKSAWAAFWVIIVGLVLAASGAYLVYKYRIRSYMDSEIRAIMAQYMPLDSQGEVVNHVNDERA